MDNYISILKLVTKTLVKFSRNLSDTDSGGSIEDEIVERDKKYTALLSNYLCITRVRNTAKEIHKWLFFWIVIISYIFVIRLVYKMINRILLQEEYHLILESIPILITAFVSCITAVVAIPLTITKFLFNTKEDNNIASIIKHMQEHDMKGLTLFKERFSKKEKGKNINFIESDGD